MELKQNKLYPSREEAEKLLSWGSGQSPGPWANHCRVTARAAETIADKCGLDADKAYVSGLLHDTGYYIYRNGKGEKDHIFSGYESLKQNVGHLP